MPCVYIHENGTWRLQEHKGPGRMERTVFTCCFLHGNIRCLFSFLILNDEGRVRRTSHRGICILPSQRASKSNAKAFKLHSFIIEVQEFILALLFSLLYFFLILTFASFAFLICRGWKTEGDVLRWNQTVCRPSPRGPSCCCASAFCSF